MATQGPSLLHDDRDHAAELSDATDAGGAGGLPSGGPVAGAASRAGRVAVRLVLPVACVCGALVALSLRAGGGPVQAAYTAGGAEDNLMVSLLYDSGHRLVSGKHGVPGLPEPPTAACLDNEERFAFLCYKKCSLLTNGTHPIRVAPMACCASKPCFSPMSLRSQLQVNGLKPCSGFFVGGRSPSSCPRPYGACWADEEYFLGQCFKKCSLLTGGEAPHRFGANTCCTRHPCWNPLHLRSQGAGCQGYGVAGGPGGGCPHKPVVPGGQQREE